MISKITLSVSGANFLPNRILNKLSGDFLVVSFFNPLDFKFDGREDRYEYGGMSFWHPNKFAVDDRIEEYEESIVEFLNTNYNLFIANFVDDIDIYIEIYYDGNNCNFEIFNKEILKKITSKNISISVSVYHQKSKEFQKWRREIQEKWEEKTQN